MVKSLLTLATILSDSLAGIIGQTTAEDQGRCNRGPGGAAPPQSPRADGVHFIFFTYTKNKILFGGAL